MKKSNIARTLVKSGIVLLAAMFVLGITACPTDDGGGKTTGSSNATLKEVKVGGVTATLGTPASTYGGITAPGSVTLITGDNQVAAAVATVSGSVIKYGLHASGEDFDVTQHLSYGATFTYEPAGDFLVIEVTATDKKTTLYYKIGVTVADVALQSLKVGEKTVSPLPNPAPTLEAAVAGNVLFGFTVDEQPAGGMTVLATALTAGSTVEYGHASGSNTPNFSATSTITFVDKEFLYIKVSSTSGSVAYYKVRVNFKMVGVIKYGSPTITNGTLDPLWDDETLQVYDIEKPYLTDFSAEGLEMLDSDEIATGKAKALWDEKGLYLLVEVTDPNGVSTNAGTPGSTAHLVDSIELFVNEGYPIPGGMTGSAAYGRGGSQYRLDTKNIRSGEGDGQTVFQGLPADKSAAWETATGYIVVFQAPWRFLGPFPIVDGKEIGFEIQINDATPDAQRHAVMVWNNVDHTNYMNALDYGVATLGADGNSLTFPAAAPVITTQPAGGTFTAGAAVTLTVVAEMVTGNDSTSITYQWYKATSNTAAGVLINGATNASYATTAPMVEGNAGAEFYYVVITNNLTNSLGDTTASVTSNRARVAAATAAPQVQQWTLGNAAYAAYKFTLLDDWVNYDKLSATYYVDAANLAKAVRGNRLYGAYVEADFTDTGTGNAYKFVNVGGNNSGNQSYNATYIMDSKSAGFPATATANTWFTFDYDISGDSGHDNFKNADPATSNPAKPDDDPVGVAGTTFYFGIGFSGNQTLAGEIGGEQVGADPDRAIVQIIKNVTLVHKTDPTKNVVSSGAGFTDQTAFIGYGGSDAIPSNITFEWVDDPTFTGDQDFELTFGAAEGKGNVITSQYAALLRVDLGADFDVTKYAKFTFDFDIYSADDTKVAAATWADGGGVQMKWRDTTSTICAQIDEYDDDPPANTDTWGFDLQNIGPTGSASSVTARTIPGYLLVKSFDKSDSATLGFNASGVAAGTYTVSPLRYLEFETASTAAWTGRVGAAGGYIKINKITFHLPE